MALDFGNKVQNMGATAQGRLTAAEFNAIIQIINEHDELLRKNWIGTESEYLALVASNQIHDDWMYAILEDEEPGGDDPQPEDVQNVYVEGDVLSISGAELSSDGETLTIHGSISQDGETLVLDGSVPEDDSQNVSVEDSGQTLTVLGALLSQDGETLELKGSISDDTLILTNN